MEDYELAYAAGIIDGEGCICITHHSGRYYELGISVTTTDTILTKWLSGTFGGNIHNHQAPRPHCKASYRWALSARKAEHFIGLILPFLKLKKSRAKLGLEFQSRKHRSRWLSEDDVAKNKEYFELMKSLNKRGV